MIRCHEDLSVLHETPVQYIKVVYMSSACHRGQPWACKGDCEMRQAVSPGVGGGVILWDKVPWSDLSRQYKFMWCPHGYCPGFNDVVDFLPQLNDSKTIYWISPFPRDKEPIPSPCIPQHIPLVGLGVNPQGKPMTWPCALYDGNWPSAWLLSCEQISAVECRGSKWPAIELCWLGFTEMDPN